MEINNLTGIMFFKGVLLVLLGIIVFVYVSYLTSHRRLKKELKECRKTARNEQ